MIENECKYILRWDLELEGDLKWTYGWCNIQQVYLNGRTRIRRKTSITTDDFIFTYKQRISAGRSVEVETAISENDFYALLPYAEQRINKHRVTIDSDGVRWDIDFIHWPVNYFIVAEAEMPISMCRPPALLAALQPHLIFQVPREDPRFSSRRLSDENHARSLARELGLAGQQCGNGIDQLGAGKWFAKETDA